MIAARTTIAMRTAVDGWKPLAMTPRMSVSPKVMVTMPTPRINLTEEARTGTNPAILLRMCHGAEGSRVRSGERAILRP